MNLLICYFLMVIIVILLLCIHICKKKSTYEELKVIYGCDVCAVVVLMLVVRELQMVAPNWNFLVVLMSLITGITIIFLCKDSFKLFKKIKAGEPNAESQKH